MKHYLLAGTSALALLAGVAGAHATTFNFTGAVVDFTVAVTGTYDITAAGAEGDRERPLVGLGALAGGDVFLTGVTVLDIAVGGGGGGRPAGQGRSERLRGLCGCRRAGGAGGRRLSPAGTAAAAASSAMAATAPERLGRRRLWPTTFAGAGGGGGARSSRPISPTPSW